MADELMAKVRADGKSVRTLTVKVRYNDMDEEQASESLTEPTDLETETYSKISALLRKAWRRRVSLRLVSLKLSNVYEGSASFRGLALDASVQHHAVEQRLAKTVDELRHKFGHTAIFRGHDFILRRKNGRGEEPVFRRPEAGAGRIRAIKNQKSKISQTSYNLAVIQRQRIGNSFARVIASPGPELRFRIETPPANGGLPSAALSSRVRASPFCNPPDLAFVPLNAHSYYSFLDSTLSVQAIVNLAQRHNLPAIALTDKNNLHGAVEFCQAAAAAGIKPILGAELDWQGHRLCLYVQNQTGYTNLCRILSEETAKGEKPKSEVQCFLPAHTEIQNPKSKIQKCTDGLLAVSPCAELAEQFPGRFYLEINSVDAFEKRPTPLPCVTSFPIPYELPSDRWKYDIVQSIRTLTLLRQPHPEKRLDGDYHFRTPAEMRKLFGAHPELLVHSVEIADRCSFSLSLGKPQFPSYPAPEGFTPAAFLHRLVMEGLRRRYPEDYARLQPQLEEELAIIIDVGYEEYFLVMWDILQECRRHGIEWITRGSAADSLACYCLDISNVCPIRFDLYFRRFLNKDRMALNKLPDIDVDFPHDRKDDVIDLIFAKYGPNQAAIVGGFSTFQSRSAFAEVAKVLGVSEFQVRRLTERLPHFSRASELAEVIPETLECCDLPLDQEPYSTALQMARFLDGFPRYPKMHPCGLVLSRQAMHEITPCFISAKGYPTTHFDMDSIEAVGLIKMDILAQGGLAVMRDVMESVRNAQSTISSPKSETNAKAQFSNTQNLGAGESLTISNGFGFVSDFGFRVSDFPLPSPAGPFDDPQVWDLIAGGSARAVHHIESPAMISLCKMCNVRDIDTLIAIVSVIRPGAANESKKMEFARRYQGLSPVHYPHPSLKPCLRSTYGLVVYEEHILQICEAFAGLPPGRADILRRALAKEKTELITQIKTEFADCARKRGCTEPEITEVWELVAGFRGYAFCKAHSTAYGVEAYQSAWLKRYYPAEFMAAVLSNGKGFYSPLVYILECHRLGIPLLPPSINDPGPQFTAVLAPDCPLSKKCIRVPVLRVKGLTKRTEKAILHERARGSFSSLADFVRRVQPLPEEMEVLIRVGAFDIFGQTRTSQYWQFKVNLETRQRAGADCALQTEDCATAQSTNQRSPIKNHQLWLLPGANLERLPAVPLSEPSRLERLRSEEELFGYPVSGHPLELFPGIAWDTYCPINRLGEHIGEQIVTCGLVIEQRLFHQITGEPMKFITIADWTGIIETELFASTYKSYGLSTIRYRVLEITATVEPFENNRGHTLRVLRAGKPRTKPVEQEATSIH
jgi:DNA-directed DNA polymerase III PolC